MKFRECCKLIKKDWDRYKYDHKSTLSIMTNPTFALVFWFRIGSWIYQKKNICVKICSIPIRIIYKTITLLTGIQLPLGTYAGGGIRFCHYSCTVIAASVKIGEDCSFHQGVTLGRTFSGKKAGVPTLEDHVVVFAGAKIIGNVHIGSHAVIGANAVVTNDVPDYNVAAGVPAKIISNNSRKCFDKHWSKYFGFIE